MFGGHLIVACSGHKLDQTGVTWQEDWKRAEFLSESPQPAV